MSVPSASFGWSCSAADGSTVRVELSANNREEVRLIVTECDHVWDNLAPLSRSQANALAAAIQLALLAVPETEDDIDAVHNQGD